MAKELTIHHERVDDLPLLLAHLDHMQVANLLDECFAPHGNWDGLSLGQVVSVWLAFMLSAANHRMSHVEPWVERRWQTLPTCLQTEMRPLDLITHLNPQDKFEFHKFSRKPQISLAQSLFTHLNPQDIELCLRNLRDFVNVGHIFFATFFEGNSEGNPPQSHSHGYFYYSREQMDAYGRKYKWNPIYIGEWNHPRDQRLFKYVAI